MKFCIIGLGRFGYEVAVTLANNGMEVLGIDENESIIAAIRDNITQAICMRVTSEESLKSIGIEEMDTVVVAMGENFAQSILVTALLKKRLNMPRVITRAINEIHQEILKLIGADDTILPEQEIGRRLADALSSPFIDHISLSENFSINQLLAPKKFLGLTVENLKLYETYKVHCIAVKKAKGRDVIPVDDTYIIEAGDRLVLAGNDDNLNALTTL